VNSPSGQFTKPILSGNDIIPLFPDLKPSSGYIKEILDRVKEWQDGGLIDMSFASMLEGPEKETKRNEAKLKTIQQIKNISMEIIQKYKEPTMAKNWFRKTCQAIPSGEVDDTIDPEIVKGPNQCPHKYHKGMRVRDRRKGMANPQEYGIVDSIHGNKVKIIWNPEDKDKKKVDVFDLVEDTHVLSLIVAEV
jgi:hypothetical protein